MAVSQLVGAKIHRREDPRLITGHGHYIDDFTRQGAAYAAFVRSPFAHARIKSIDVTDASKAPGVAGVYTARDFKGQLAGTHPAAPAFVAEKKYIPERFPIAEKEACYQGEIVAAVLAETKGQAADAANLIQVEYEELPAVMDLEKAMASESPKAHMGAADNISWDLTYTGPEVSEAAFKEADVVVKERILQNRLAPVPMEPRGVLAEFETYDKKLTIWMSSQNPHFIRLFVSGAMGLKESQVRVISPDVGGGFGSKISPYPEDYLVPALSRLAERPVKWIETRTESIQNATHGRGQFYDVEVAAKKDGTLLGMRMTQFLDVGAYVGTFSAFQACACLMAGGAYKWKGISARTIGILTNRVPTDPYRGAGRPEATHLVERMVDLVARELKMDPVEIRKKNFIQPQEFPFTQNFGLVVDSGEYARALDVALKLAGYDDLRKKQADLRKQGRYLGIGLSTWIELCGFGPSAATAPATGGIALVESAQVRVTPTGSVIVYTGTHSHGQGHETTFPQIVADQLGVPYESIELRHGDTAEGTAFGYGTYGSRSLAVGGVAISKAVGKVIDKGKKLAAHMLEAAEEDVVYEHGAFHVKGSPDKSKAFGEVAFASYGMNLPEGMEQGLEAVAYFDPPNLVWPFGTHIAVVEVDAETGSAKLEKYIAVDDCGNIINPMIVDGQIHGGIVQGVAQALYEEVVYDDETGQLKTGTLLDYMLPSANEIPPLFLDHTITPSPTNDLGVKGIGEAGTIAASAAVINAICDALSPLGIKHVDMPASPDKLWKMMKEARQ
ncbi:MAG: xanthine dehydrogenase family protein molybdopterin-binding subunit [Chloroflexi bacterium]|nr:MAG: xanthine dehydrogenase family protein molybdopterin-binding subunit [Chloroflexota bacterium]